MAAFKELYGLSTFQNVEIYSFWNLVLSGATMRNKIGVDLLMQLGLMKIMKEELPLTKSLLIMIMLDAQS